VDESYMGDFPGVCVCVCVCLCVFSFLLRRHSRNNLVVSYVVHLHIPTIEERMGRGLFTGSRAVPRIASEMLNRPINLFLVNFKTHHEDSVKTASTPANFLLLSRFGCGS